MQSVRTRIEQLLPPHLAKQLEKLPDNTEEIRLRTGRLPSLLLPEGERCFGTAEIVWNDLAYVLDRAGRFSLHAIARELKQGYISAGSGIRIGVCGRVCSGGIESYQDVSSLAVRLPHEIRGVGEKTIKALSPFENSVLIVSSPGGGKTTFLRELIRTASDSGKRVCVCDERNEIAAVWKGCASFDLGQHTDILCGTGKAEGITMLMRSMNPEIIAIDEIGTEEDVKAIGQAAGCGAVLFASVHGFDLKELRKRLLINKLLSEGIFGRAVLISGKGSRRYGLVNL